MEIKPFKMKVTPEQSRIVQQTLFSNNYTWFSGDTTIENLSSPHLYFYEDILRQTENFQEDFFVTHELPELTFQEFFDRYVKWCIRGSKELALWQLEDMHDKCDCHFREDNIYYKPISGLLFWTPYNKIPENHIEIIFEQFKQYVLKTKENKVMEKKIIGYRLKEDCKKYIPALDVICSYFADGDYKFEINSTYYEEFKKAGVLDLWFEPVYEKSSKELYFGKIKFTINKGDDFATTEYGKVIKEEIKNAIDYIENPPSLVGNKLTIHTNNGYNTITKCDTPISHFKIGFGCQSGTLKQLKEIYSAFE